MRSDRNGFTLTELLILVVIVGLMTTLARPAISALRSEANASTAALASTLQAAQREAVTRQHDVLVQFDAPNRRLVVVLDADNSGAANGTERVRNVPLYDGMVMARPTTVAARTFGTGPVSFAAGTGGLPTLTFRRNGAASAAGGFYVTSARAVQGDRRRDADTRALEIVRATGRVEWWRWTGSAWRRGNT
jgi:Tfp pilus assembly protein FimT